GAAAADALLAAAETSTDLEVALRAGWLAASIPLATGRESPDAARLLEAYASSSDLRERIGVMPRLLRLDDDQGVESLARIVRLEREPLGSRIAAALIVQDWQPDDPYWPRMVPGMLAGLGNSNRPAARFLRGLAAATTEASPVAAAAAADTCGSAIDLLDTISTTATDAQEGDGSSTAALAGRVFRRCVAALLAAQGRKAEALAAAGPLFSDSSQLVAAERLADDLQWLAHHGLPEAVELVSARLVDEADPLVIYAAAVAWRQRPEAEAAARAADLAARGRRLLEETAPLERLTLAILLARWGGSEWADETYRGILAAATRPGEAALTAINYAEFLHDQDRDDRAAEVMRGILTADGQEREDLKQGLLQLDRDPRAVRSRMLFFAACAADDEPTRRQLIEESLKAYPDDVDSLIAAYRLTGDDPVRRAEVVAQITRTAAALDRELKSLSFEPSLRNEYAWLIANTEGDLAKATRYSQESLEASADQASYLDTLAHCQAAAGRLEQAVRTQWLAVKQEPHSLMIRRNFARFRSLAGGQP
ncbi:MAG: hypothetical protein RLZZ440_1373, partial [Planctomycetota bacterium]